MGTVFDAAGGTIGRANDNDWVLPDPERFISGNHAKITQQNGQYYLLDTSTNGIYLNTNPQPIGKGNSVPLSNGDRVLIGDYEIEVSLDNVQTNAASLDAAVEEDFFTPPPQHSGFSAFDDNPYKLDDTAGSENTGPTSSSYFDSPDSSPGITEPDHVAAENQFFQPPQSIPQTPADTSPSIPSIPDNWNPLEDDLESDEDFAPSQLAPPAPEPFPVTPLPVTTGQATSNDDLASLNKLLEGAGLQPIDIPSDQADETLRLIGSILREMVSGVMEILRARADIKSEFRMQLTTIRPVENNPLKFSVGVDDAMKHLLASNNSAYLPPLESVCQAIVDIQAHQLAVMAGMQAALSAMLEKFEPTALEEYFSRKGGRSILESKKAWYWEQYGEKHKELLMEAEDNFQEFFGEEFARAYESQITKLVQAHKKN